MPLLKNADRVLELVLPGATLNSAARLTGGVSAKVYRLDIRLADESPYSAVLRVHGETHCGHSAQLEFQLLEALFRSGLPVPRPLGFGGDSELLGHPFVLIDFVEGSSEIKAQNLETCIGKMAEMLVAVHRTRTADLPSLPLRMDPFPELFEFLEGDDEWSDLRAKLTKLNDTAYRGTPVLLHGDFWPENLIWSDGHIAAILDWEDAAVGDPLSDIACTCLEIRYLFGDKGVREFKNAYAKHDRIEQGRLSLWLLYVAAAALMHMGDWRLPPHREANMRREAKETLRQATLDLFG
ncbi:MAG: phosphotransferase [Pseudomonadota bacterium]